MVIKSVYAQRVCRLGQVGLPRFLIAPCALIVSLHQFTSQFRLIPVGYSTLALHMDFMQLDRTYFYAFNYGWRTGSSDYSWSLNNKILCTTIQLCISCTCFNRPDPNCFVQRNPRRIEFKYTIASYWSFKKIIDLRHRSKPEVYPCFFPDCLGRFKRCFVSFLG